MECDKPYVSHPPSDISETWRPERPRNLYFIFGRDSEAITVLGFGSAINQVVECENVNSMQLQDSTML